MSHQNLNLISNLVGGRSRISNANELENVGGRPQASRLSARASLFPRTLEASTTGSFNLEWPDFIVKLTMRFHRFGPARVGAEAQLAHLALSSSFTLVVVVAVALVPPLEPPIRLVASVMQNKTQRPSHNNRSPQDALKSKMKRSKRAHIGRDLNLYSNLSNKTPENHRLAWPIWLAVLKLLAGRPNRGEKPQSSFWCDP